MANVFLHNPNTCKTTLCLFLLTTTFFIANSARILDEVDTQPQTIGTNLPTGPVTTTIPQIGPISTTLPSGQSPAATSTNPATSEPVEEDANAIANPSVPVTATIPQIGPISTTLPSGQSPAATSTNPATSEPVEEDANAIANPSVPETEDIIPPVASPTTEETPEAEVPAVPDATPVMTTTKPVAKEPSLSFFMHDILGGSHPSARVVAGIVANTDVTGLPFSKNNNNIFPITGGIPLVNPKLNGIITNNNLPNLVGLNAAQSSTVFKNSGTSNTVTGGDNQPFVSAGNLPGGLSIQKLMFGSVTVVDDQLTEGHELDSSVIGRAQGFYLASSLDGTSKTIVLTVLAHGGEHHDGVEDTINLFGVHRTVSHESEIAVIGGTGKYENAKGYAALETLLKEDQHTTDGVDTILHFNIYLTE